MRALVLIVGMTMWVAMIGFSFWMKQIPGAVLVGFPAGLWVALRPPGRTINRDGGASSAPVDREDSAS